MRRIEGYREIILAGRSNREHYEYVSLNQLSFTSYSCIFVITCSLYTRISASFVEAGYFDSKFDIVDYRRSLSVYVCICLSSNADVGFYELFLFAVVAGEMTNVVHTKLTEYNMQTHFSVLP